MDRGDGRDADCDAHDRQHDARRPAARRAGDEGAQDQPEPLQV